MLALHDIIQVTVGWTDSHLFEFVVGDRVYSEPLPDDELFERKVYNAAGIRLRTLIGRGVERLLYVYDFGDDWRHDVIIEDVRDGAPDIDYPAFVAARPRMSEARPASCSSSRRPSTRSTTSTKRC